MGAKHSKGRPAGTVPGKWEDCPAYDLEPMSRTASVVVSMTRAPRSRKASSCMDYPPQPVVQGDRPDSGNVRTAAAEQAQAGPTTSSSTVNSAPQQADSAFTSPPADLPSDPDSPYCDMDGPSPQPQDRTHIQHRVALRLLERKGTLADASVSPRNGSGASAGGASDASPPLHAGAGAGRSAYASAVSSVAGSVAGSPHSTVPPSPVPSSGYYTPAGSAATSPLGIGESPVDADERMCLQQAELEEGLVVANPVASQTELIYRQPQTPYQIITPPPHGKNMWAAEGRRTGSGDGTSGRTPGSGASAGNTPGSGAPVVNAKPAIGPRVVPPPMLVLPASGVGTPGAPSAGSCAAAAASLSPFSSSMLPPVGLAVAEATQADADRHRFTPRAWSAAGGRQELSQEEKEWLFGRPGGIGGLAPVVALGEGGEGLVDLVRLELPGRTVHLARKATRTSVPSFAVNGSGVGAAILGKGFGKNVAYRFPFECFDREVKAMKAVKECGFVMRFQAAAYDHDKGQGFILMEAAPYGTLQDLHNALCRSAVQSVARTRAPLMQRALAKFSSVATKASPPPSMQLAADASSRSLNIAAIADRPSRPPGGGIGSCGQGPAQDAAEAAPDADAGSPSGAPGCSDRFSCCSASTLGSAGGALEQQDRDPRGSRGMAHAATAPASPAIGAVGGGGAGPSPGGGPVVSGLGSSLMSSRALRYYGACMLQALVALHGAGYVYRDLKLSNVLVCEGGRVRLTDFGAAATCLPDRPGLFGGVAGTRLYLAPELLPWLEAEEGSARGGRRDSASSPPPYTVTVDSWTWGLVMVELATGWSLKELTQRVIRRVCHPRHPQPPELPPDCGLPPLLRQLLLEHVLLADPAARWSAERIKGHAFFEGLDWEHLPTAEGPHAHLFKGDGHASNAAVDASPDVVAAAMRAAAATNTAGRRGVLAAGLPGGGGSGGEVLQAGNSPLGGPGGYVMTSNPAASGNSQTNVTPFTPLRNSGNGASGGSGGGRSRGPTGTGILPVPPLLPPGSAPSVTASPAAAAALAAAVAAGAVGLEAAARPHRLSASGLAAGNADRRSSPGCGPLIGPVVPSPSAGSGGGAAPALGGSGAFSSRRHTTGLAVGGSRLSAGTLPA